MVLTGGTAMILPTISAGVMIGFLVPHFRSLKRVVLTK